MKKIAVEMKNCDFVLAIFGATYRMYAKDNRLPQPKWEDQKLSTHTAPVL